MRKVGLLSFLLISLFIQGMAQDYRLKPWPNGAPNKNTPPGEEKFYTERGTSRYENISEAELFVYLPDKSKNTGAAVVICPGGGYHVEAIQHEGFMMAEYLKQNGIAGIVLKYRLPYGQHEIPLADDDKTVDPENSIRFYQAMKKEHVPAEMHIFHQGGHGFGMNKINTPAEQWPDMFVQWMKSMNFTK